ncbi:MAG: SWIM zinc finger family protein [Saprospiraceae bacterium]
MNGILLKDYISRLASKSPKTLTNLIVRELEEESPGQYICFVDDGVESHDVHLKISSLNIIENTACDCGKKDPCRHITAALREINKPSHKKSGLPRRTKQSKEVDHLLIDIDTNDLKLWVSDLLEKNKELLFQFKLQFKKKEGLTIEDIVKETKLGLQSVIGNRKIIKLEELRKIIVLWRKIHTPIIERCINEITLPSSLPTIDAIVNEIIRIETHLGGFNKFGSYTLTLFTLLPDAIASIDKPVTWDYVVSFFIDRIVNLKNNTHIEIYEIITYQILDKASISQKENILNRLSNIILSIHEERGVHYLSSAMVKKLYNQVLKHDLFNKYHSLFKTNYGDNDYNLSLIHETLKLGLEKEAGALCKECIERNYQVHYSLPYYNILKEIYAAKNDKISLLKIAKTLFPFTYDFDDYCLIKNQITDPTKQKEFRDIYYHKARRSLSQHNINEVIFCYKVLDSEKNYEDMVSLILNFSTYPLILEYIDKMYNASPIKLLANLTSHLGNRMEYQNKRLDDKNISALHVLVSKAVGYYGIDGIKMQIKKVNAKSIFSNSNPFIKCFEYLFNGGEEMTQEAEKEENFRGRPRRR